MGILLYILLYCTSYFPSFLMASKCYNENTRDAQHRYFNQTLCSARVVSENTYEMLKGRWHFLYKKTASQPKNLCYFMMLCIALHNLCIVEKNPCKPHWQLEIQQLDLIQSSLDQEKSKVQSNVNQMKISNWLQVNHQNCLLHMYELSLPQY